MFGNSLADGEYVVDVLASFPARPLPSPADSPPNVYWEYNTSAMNSVKYSQSGTAVTEMLAQLNLYGPGWYRPETSLNVTSIGGGTNDYIQGKSVAVVYAQLLEFVATSHVMGYQHVIIETVPSATQFNPAPGNTWRNDLNAAITGGAVANNYTVSDIASDPIIGCQTCYQNTTYFADGVHFTSAGKLIKAQYMYNALYALGFR